MTTSPLEDPVARRLFPWSRSAVFSAVGQPLARVASLGLVDHIALRTAAIDAMLAGGFAQLVLLGAGLDARAYRLPRIGRVFEVDHPASQKLKLKYAGRLTPRAESVVHIAADFLEDDVADLLARAGHDASVPTAWIVEGVAVYLPESFTTRLLEVAGSRSAPGSALALTYIRASKMPIARSAGAVMLRALGEPLGTPFSREKIAAHVRAAGLEVESDTNDRDWSVRFGASAALARAFRDERLLVARKR